MSEGTKIAMNGTGWAGVCLSLAAAVDRKDMRTVIPVPLSDQEVRCLVNSAASIRAMLAQDASGRKA